MEGVWNHRGGVRWDLESGLGYLSSFGWVDICAFELAGTENWEGAVPFRDGIATCMYKRIDHSWNHGLRVLCTSSITA